MKCFFFEESRLINQTHHQCFTFVGKTHKSLGAASALKRIRKEPLDTDWDIPHGEKHKPFFCPNAFVGKTHRFEVVVIGNQLWLCGIARLRAVPTDPARGSGLGRSGDLTWWARKSRPGRAGISCHRFASDTEQSPRESACRYVPSTAWKAMTLWLTACRSLSKSKEREKKSNKTGRCGLCVRGAGATVRTQLRPCEEYTSSSC